MSQGVFIVGGEGFLGSHITRGCLTSGRAVTTFGPPMTVDLLSQVSGPLTRLRGSAEHLPEIRNALRNSNAGAVVWAAGFNAGDAGLMASGELDAARAIAVNVGAWANVLKAAVECGVGRVVACGSSVVYGATTDYTGPVNESAAQLPRTLYGLTKALAETTAAHFANTHGLDVVTLRLPLVAGPGRWYGGAAAAMARLIGAAARGESISVEAPAEAFDLIYVKDAARAVTELLSARHTAPVYNIKGFTTSYGEILTVLRALRPAWDASVALKPSPWHFPLMDVSLLEREQGFRPTWALEAAMLDHLKEI